MSIITIISHKRSVSNTDEVQHEVHVAGPGLSASDVAQILREAADGIESQTDTEAEES